VTIRAIVFAVAVLGQSNAPPKKAVAPVKLGNTFCKTALVALKAIQRDESTPTIKEGKLYANGITTTLIDRVDIEASTKQEKAVSDGLHQIYFGRLVNNLKRETLRLQLKEEERVKEPKWVEMNETENRCFDALDRRLHLRSVGVPPECAAMVEAANQPMN
jgi:hypothetical protein